MLTVETAVRSVVFGEYPSVCAQSTCSCVCVFGLFNYLSVGTHLVGFWFDFVECLLVCAVEFHNR